MSETSVLTLFAFPLAMIVCSGAANLAEEGKTTVKTKIEWGPELLGAKCSIASCDGQLTFVAGEPLWVEVQTKHFGTQKISVVQTAPVHVFTFEIVGPDGNPVPFTKYGKMCFESDPAEVAVTELKPGAEELDKLHLSRMFDVTLAGKYELFCSRVLIGPDRSSHRMRSNKLTITITDPGEKQSD